MIDRCKYETVNTKEYEAHRAAKREMFKANKAHKDALEEQLQKKIKQLRQLCLQEAVSSRWIDSLNKLLHVHRFERDEFQACYVLMLTFVNASERIK